MTITTEPVEWIKALAPLAAALIQLGAAGLVAVLGFRYGLRKTRDERGFDRRVAWYEAAIAAVGALREALTAAAVAERGRADLREADGSWQAGHESAAEATFAAWRDARARGVDLVRILGHAPIYADPGSDAAAGRAIRAVTEAADQFVDLVEWDPGSHPTDEHPLHVTDAGAQSLDLAAVFLNLRDLERVLVQDARATLGYPPRAAAGA